MILLKLLIFTLTFHELIVDLDARRICPKGQRVTNDGSGCEMCPGDSYQPEQNDSQYCKACTKCEADTGSVVKEKCTKETNTKCQCRGNFVPWESDSSTCKCEAGFGLKFEECSKCEYGYFSTRINSPCQKWKECKCGVNITGSETSDVICKAEIQGCSNTYITTPPTSNKIVSLMTRLTSHRPHEETQTQRMRSATTTAELGHTVPTGNKGQPFHPSDTSVTYIGMALFIFGIIGLMALTAVTCKHHISPQPPLPDNESSCRCPVEESGDSSQSESREALRSPINLSTKTVNF